MKSFSFADLSTFLIVVFTGNENFLKIVTNVNLLKKSVNSKLIKLKNNEKIKIF